MEYVITERVLDEIISFARDHVDYDFHCETVGFEDNVLSCIFNRESDDNSVIFELEGRR